MMVRAEMLPNRFVIHRCFEIRGTGVWRSGFNLYNSSLELISLNNTLCT